MADQEQGFVIRDRRGGATEASSSPVSKPAAQEQAVPGSATSAQSAPSMPVSFSSFIISLGSSSLMLMGEQLDPGQQPLSVNLSQAKEIIDVLSVLEEKTKGNLTPDEQTLLRDMLYAVRMKYVTATSKK
jgi:hypothetical protein